MNINPEKYINELKKFDTATIPNNIEKFKVRDDTTGHSSMELKCLAPDDIVPPHRYGNFIEIGVTVSIFGLMIKQGDLLHGDENGLVKIPKDKIEVGEILERQNIF